MKIGKLDVSGAELAQAFSLDPPNGNWPRLRIQGLQPGSHEFRSAHEGAVALIRGAFMLIRNGASHPTEREFTEDEGLEHLAVLSLVARLIDNCDISSAGTTS